MPASDTDPAFDASLIVAAALDRWTGGLIDLSRSNSLLFFRTLKVGTLDLSGETDLVERLLSGRAVPIVPLLVDPLGGETLEKGLVAILRKARTNFEERGIETLFLASGMATWPASDGGRPYQAPLLLRQVVDRGRQAGVQQLAVKGEPELNPVLMHVLRESYRIRIDAGELMTLCSVEEENGRWRVDEEHLFARIAEDASALKGFAIERRVVLGNFQFAKMAMVEDLKNNTSAITRSRVVAAIAGDGAARQELRRNSVRFDAIDLDGRPVAGDYQVLDADSTQQRAIVLAGIGESGVIHGPPGTGKSQTIANLIAQSIAEGRRVLFVAEKRAALDAVLKRLAHPAVGLGHLVLDLHGASISKKKIMAGLANALEQIRQAGAADGAEQLHNELEKRRLQLNEHARRINTPRPPTGLSVSRMIGRLLDLPAEARSNLRLRGTTLFELTPQRFDDLRGLLVDGAASSALLLGVDPSPWNNAKIYEGYTPQQAHDIAVLADSRLWPRFQSTLQSAVQSLGVRSPHTLEETATLLELLADITRVRERYAAGIFETRAHQLAVALEPASGGFISRIWSLVTSSEYRAARTTLQALRTTPASDATLLDDARRLRDLQQRWQTFDPGSAPPADRAAPAELAEAFEALTGATTPLGRVVAAGSFDAIPFAEVAARIHALASDRSTPYRLAGIYATRAGLEAAGLAPLLDELRDDGVRSELWPSRLEYIRASSALEEGLASDPALAMFNGRTHEQIVAEFVRLDRERLMLAAKRVRELHARRAVEAMNNYPEQESAVRAEAAKRSRHRTLRDLMAVAPDVLTRIVPCWVASPLSVSQLLDGSDRHFDIVIFDEASQVLQEEAIPSLYRARQVVVAGDQHQLPPTTFFATTIGEEEKIDDEPDEARSVAAAAIGGFESLLATLQALLPSWLLEWHYRSEDERLIAFSNVHIYDHRLVTFPSAHVGRAIRHILVPHEVVSATDQESASREVDEVVRQVLAHASESPGESLGVIAMGIKHANRIEAALDIALASRPELSGFFALEREERFFIKNLESVQGDERDAIILSIGYGKTAGGDLPHRFGPLTHAAGHRRLNVAITRARRRMTTISSFTHDDIDLNRSGSRGVELLKSYLEFATTGGTGLPGAERTEAAGGDDVRSDIRATLEARGMTIRQQYGTSRYRIELAAMHPTIADRPVLAIECDGTSYSAGTTARDRDRLRQEHLQRLGWHYHRIWTIDWFNNREAEIERAVAAYHEAVRRADAADEAIRPLVSAPTPPAPLPTPEPAAPLPQRHPRPEMPWRGSIDRYSDEELHAVVRWIGSDGLLRTEEEILVEMKEALGAQRRTAGLRERLEAVLRQI